MLPVKVITIINDGMSTFKLTITSNIFLHANIFIQIVLRMQSPESFDDVYISDVEWEREGYDVNYCVGSYKDWEVTLSDIVDA